MMSHLCNRCVREFLILARTWFAFGLPSKTGCDSILLAGPRLLCEEYGCDSSTPRGTGGGVHPLGCPRSTHRRRASPSLASAGSLAATTRAGMAVASKAKG